MDYQYVWRSRQKTVGLSKLVVFSVHVNVPFVLQVATVYHDN